MEMRSSKDIENYKEVLGQFCTGITVITSLHGDDPVGFTCQSFTALSMQPPMILLCSQKNSRSWPRIREVGTFVVNVMAANQRWVSDSFAQSGADKFSGVEWSVTSQGLPAIEGSLAWIECEVTEEIDAGDHTIVIGGIQGFGLGKAGEPLLFHRGKYLNQPQKELQPL